ncbi:MAG: hypothetical protein HXX20_04265 [Chloroflexi bacterium]|nr:hypothetical protein [Chloroflexota bacterium]
MKATDFLNGTASGCSEPVSLDYVPSEGEGTPSQSSLIEQGEADYHVRAGRIGGQTTKQRHRDSNFYKEIGARGGTTTMARHGADYSERRKKGGDTTLERYGEEYYHTIAAKAARTKQDATRLRNSAIKVLMMQGFKIPTIIKLTLEDLKSDPRLQPLTQTGPLAEYLEQRPDAENQSLFLSQSGKPLSLANTYTIMERHQSAEEF